MNIAATINMIIHDDLRESTIIDLESGALTSGEDDFEAIISFLEEKVFTILQRLFVI